MNFRLPLLIFTCRFCNKTGRLDLLIKYAKRFIKAGVNLRTASFDMWMELAANRGTDCCLFVFLNASCLDVISNILSWIFFVALIMTGRVWVWFKVQGCGSLIVFGKSLLLCSSTFWVAEICNFDFFFIPLLGDVESLWKAEKLRSKSKKQHTLVSGFACAEVIYLFVALRWKYRTLLVC